MSNRSRRSVRSRSSASAARRSPVWETVRSYSGPKVSCSLRLRRWRPAKKASRASSTSTTTMAMTRPVSMGISFPRSPCPLSRRNRETNITGPAGSGSDHCRTLGPGQPQEPSAGGRGQRRGGLGVLAAVVDQAAGGFGDLGRVGRLRRPPGAELVVVVAGQHVDVQVEDGLVADRAVGVGLDEVDPAGPERPPHPAGHPPGHGGHGQPVAGVGRQHVGHVAPGHDQDVPEGGRADVHEGDGPLVLVDQIGRQLARDDLAEGAICLHARVLPPETVQAGSVTRNGYPPIWDMPRAGWTKSGSLIRWPHCLRATASRYTRATSSSPAPERRTERRSYSVVANRQVRTWPSAVRRMRSHWAQKARVTEAITPTAPRPSR